MTERLSTRLHLGPVPWPNAKIDPNEMEKFIPNGLGLGAPMIMRPWDSLEDLERQGGYYGFNVPTGHPVKDAPTNVAEGGVIYFDDNPQQSAFEGLLGLLGIQDALKEYAVVWSESQNPLEDRYLGQLRIVSKWALSGVFEAPLAEGMEPLIAQPLTVGEALWGFIEDQKAYWGEDRYSKLDGTLGGDGDWARESLSFGLMVENSYHHIYRIWSRPWLVTK